KKLSEILQDLKEGKYDAKKTNQYTEDVEHYSSILKFPSFLLHILRLIKKDDSIKIKDQDLIAIFDKHLSKEQEEVENFFRKLLHYRILFDRYVIKRLKDDDSPWRIRELKLNNDGSYSRQSKEENRPLEMLEAFLQVSTQQNHWLNFLLNKIGKEEVDNEKLIKHLECFDYFWAKIRLARLESGKQVDLEKLFKTETIPNWGLLDNGTNTPRYWFFKLDYLLWKLLWKDTWKDKWKDREKNTRLKNFQFRENRSVEHVHARNQDNEINNKWDEELVDSFGNLALISVSSNSQNSNKSFELKKLLFEPRLIKYGCESLKLAFIFENNEWTKKECKEHKAKMIEILQEDLKSFERDLSS
ncbi:MAG: DUF1524 domain-containing protein, partial [Bacteroidales bacterium]|nr:DUF1524 domain-containing protein [Bacteroidales bacterium]